MSQEPKDWVVTVDLSRIERCSVALAITATTASEAEALARAIGREACDGKRRIDAFTSSSGRWVLDEAHAELAPADPAPIELTSPC